MAERQIVLDTETTGIRVEEGHRIIEIGCIELDNRRLTGRTFHQYINPCREVEEGAQAVHGITNAFLQDKPTFPVIAPDLIAFIEGAELIIHNAPFDISFLDHEFALARAGYKKISQYCTILDTLPLARKLHVGQRNNLDALCKRYHVDNAKREFHGALLDAHLLLQVYLAMTGGQGHFFDLMNQSEQSTANKVKQASTVVEKSNSYQLTVIMPEESELASHQEYLERLQKNGKCVWKEDD